MSYNKVLKQFGEIDLDIFGSVVPLVLIIYIYL